MRRVLQLFIPAHVRVRTSNRLDNAAPPGPVFSLRCERCAVLRRYGRAMQNGSDADVVYCLNRTRLPVIGTELYRAQLSELTRPPRCQKWPRTGATGATRRAGTRCVKHNARRGASTRPVCRCRNNDLQTAFHFSK